MVENNTLIFCAKSSAFSHFYAHFLHVCISVKISKIHVVFSNFKFFSQHTNTKFSHFRIKFEYIKNVLKSSEINMFSKQLGQVSILMVYHKLL